MADSPMVGCRVPLEWQLKVRGIANASGRKEAEVVREAIAKYLGEANPDTIKSTLEQHEQRLAEVERKLGALGQLIR
ncbi:MAG: hypothetical protein F6K58_25905 [Symploca sp. SIO2E9]|nr:hypothetical protein [Symploca sp. SIO2E9]